MTHPPNEPLALRTLLWRLALGLFMLLLVVGALGVLFRDPVERVAEWFVAEFGLLGIFLVVTVVDALPLTHEPILLLGYSGGLGFWQVWAAASAGSVMSGVLAWSLGGWLSRFEIVQRQLARYRIDVFLRRYGGWAVAVAAITPFPYSVATWASGAARMPFLPLFLGALARLPKVLIYLSLIALGWSTGG